MSKATATPSHKRFGKPDLARMGQFLRDERKTRGLSVRALGEKSGLSTGAIRALEAGQANSSLATVLAVVEALDVDLDQTVEAARAEGRSVVVNRAGAQAASVLAGAALDLEVVELAPKSVGPAPRAGETHPCMGLVVDGSVVVGRSNGARYRLEKGDVYHAQPGIVQGLAGATARSARIMVVTDTRRTGERPSGPVRTKS